MKPRCIFCNSFAFKFHFKLKDFLVSFSAAWGIVRLAACCLFKLQGICCLAGLHSQWMSFLLESSSILLFIECARHFNALEDWQYSCNTAGASLRLLVIGGRQIKREKRGGGMTSWGQSQLSRMTMVSGHDLCHHRSIISTCFHSLHRKPPRGALHYNRAGN